MNVINQSGLLAISTRLQRLSDQIRKDGQKIYALYGIDFEPKWFPVIYTLYQKDLLSVVEIANEIGYTHPSTISLLKELEKQKIIRSKRDKSDERKRLLTLTEKGKALVDQMQPVWKTMIAALTTLTTTPNNIMKALEEVEEEMEKQSFFQRAAQLNKNSNA